MNARSSMSTTLEELARKFLAEDGEVATQFIRQQWLSRVVETLREARHEANLTQQQLACKLGTTQSAIARLENDSSGGVSIRRVIDYLLACGVAPFDIAYVPVNEMRRFAYSDPTGRHTEPRYARWRSKRQRGNQGASPWISDWETEGERWRNMRSRPEHPRPARGMSSSPAHENLSTVSFMLFSHMEETPEETGSSMYGPGWTLEDQKLVHGYVDESSDSVFASEDHELVAAVA